MVKAQLENDPNQANMALEATGDVPVNQLVLVGIVITVYNIMHTGHTGDSYTLLYMQQCIFLLIADYWQQTI